MILFIAGWIIGILIGLFFAGRSQGLNTKESIVFVYKIIIEGFKYLKNEIEVLIRELRNK